MDYLQITLSWGVSWRVKIWPR